MNNICNKTIVISIILLLIGVSVSSAYSIDTKSTTSNNESVEDCNCKEIDSKHFIRLERQLNKLEVYSKLLLVLSKHNPELLEDYEELSNKISTLKEELADDTPYPVICRIINKINDILNEFVGFFAERYYSSEPGSFERRIWSLLYDIVLLTLMPIFLPIWFMGTYVFECWEMQ